MQKTKYYTILFGVCTLSSAMGVALGYFIFSPIGGSTGVIGANAAHYSSYYLDEIPAYVNFDISAVQETDPEIPYELTHEISYSYIVTSHEGFIAVYRAGEKPELMEITTTPTNALPQEEQDRLSQGIHIHTEEALIRILEDFGS